MFDTTLVPTLLLIDFILRGRLHWNKGGSSRKLYPLASEERSLII